MLALTTAMWIAAALLTPFWWGLALFVLALLGSGSSRWHPRVARVFDRIEHTRTDPADETVFSLRVAS